MELGAAVVREVAKLGAAPPASVTYDEASQLVRVNLPAGTSGVDSAGTSGSVKGGAGASSTPVPCVYVPSPQKLPATLGA